MSFSCLLKKIIVVARVTLVIIKLYPAVLAGNFGTGSISGMAVAISTGGPGALVWMWVLAFGLPFRTYKLHLGVKYRRLNAKRRIRWWSMYC